MRVNGATAVCIHGMWGTSKRFDTWKPVIEEHMPVRAIDLERSQRSIKYTDYVRQVEKFIQGINADKIFVIGHSMGGLLAQAAEDSRIVARGLVSPAPPNNIFNGFGFLKRVLTEAGLSSLRQIDQIFTRYSRPTNKEAERIICNKHKDLGLNFDFNEAQKLSIRVYLEVAFGIGTKVPKRENVHVVVGSDDLLTEPRDVKKVAELHDGTFEIIPGQDHISLTYNKGVARNLMEKMVGNGRI